MERIYNFRAEYTKYIAEPALGESGVGGAMAVYGAFDAIVSMALQKWVALWNGLHELAHLVSLFLFYVH